ncbi:hypothetical protein KSP39_PZI013653 [Platanthera zijinensis]|uniref:Uncharacterized protein n=1 Tax=Platanthera zijinensis TaxID=2320716 RepID=A0AAP0G3J9_9ASPA
MVIHAVRQFYSSAKCGWMVPMVLPVGFGLLYRGFPMIWDSTSAGNRDLPTGSYLLRGEHCFVKPHRSEVIPPIETVVDDGRTIAVGVASHCHSSSHLSREFGREALGTRCQQLDTRLYPPPPPENFSINSPPGILEMTLFEEAEVPPSGYSPSPCLPSTSPNLLVAEGKLLLSFRVHGMLDMRGVTPFRYPPVELSRLANGLGASGDYSVLVNRGDRPLPLQLGGERVRLRLLAGNRLRRGNDLDAEMRGIAIKLRCWRRSALACRGRLPPSASSGTWASPSWWSTGGALVARWWLVVAGR